MFSLLVRKSSDFLSRASARPSYPSLSRLSITIYSDTSVYSISAPNGSTLSCYQGVTAFCEIQRQAITQCRITSFFPLHVHPRMRTRLLTRSHTKSPACWISSHAFFITRKDQRLEDPMLPLDEVFCKLPLESTQPSTFRSIRLSWPKLGNMLKFSPSTCVVRTPSLWPI